jgi:hypothetical protein
VNQGWAPCGGGPDDATLDGAGAPDAPLDAAAEGADAACDAAGSGVADAEAIAAEAVGTTGFSGAGLATEGGLFSPMAPTALTIWSRNASAVAPSAAAMRRTHLRLAPFFRSPGV